MKPEVSIIKELNEQNPEDFIYVKMLQKLSKEILQEWVSLLYHVLLGFLLIMDSVILARALAL
jgi:hypothetical protein